MFYVSAIELEGRKRRWLLAGPYAKHEDALRQVTAVKRLACASEPFAHFYAWGTCSSETTITTPLGAEF